MQPEGKYVVDIDRSIDKALLTTGARVALKADNYMLHKILPSKVLFRVGDSTAENVRRSIHSCR